MSPYVDVRNLPATKLGAEMAELAASCSSICEKTAGRPKLGKCLLAPPTASAGASRAPRLEKRSQMTEFGRLAERFGRHGLQNGECTTVETYRFVVDVNGQARSCGGLMPKTHGCPTYQLVRVESRAVP